MPGKWKKTAKGHGASVRLEPLRSVTQPLLSSSLPPLPSNPLDVFPSKSDTISKTFFHLDAEKHRKKLQRKEDTVHRWLDPQKIDPTFGLPEDHTDIKRDLRRAYRRIESSALFKPMLPHEISLSDLNAPTKRGKNFVLVEESRLQELSRLEGILQQEKRLLGEQCAWVMDDFQFHARIPLPATRLAIRNLCDEQIRKAQAEADKLTQTWKDFCLNNHYDKPHLYTTESYLKAAPAGQRALKLRLVREAAQTWRLRKDRDTMRFEDDLSYLSGKCYEAKLRAKDYERYFILAARYGPFTEEEFNADPRPGKRYYIKAVRGAIKLQMAWDRYWAVQRLRRYRACRLIQKYVRRRQVFKRLYPIIRLRLKVGKKTYYMYCWNMWLEYNRICRRIREAIEYRLESTTRHYFDAWNKYVAGRKAQRVQNVQLMRIRTANANLYNKFARWQHYTRSNRKLKLHLKRLFAFPHFDVWVEYTKWSKHVKRLNRAATCMQSLVRMFVGRVLLLRAKRAQVTLKGFNLLVLCVRTVRAKRQAQVAKEYDEWKPQELVRRAHRLNDLERARILKRQSQAQEKEKAAQRQLRKHFKSSDGQLQLAEMIQDPSTAAAYNQQPMFQSGRRGFSAHTTLTEDLDRSTKEQKSGFSSLTKTAKMNYAQSLLLRECAAVARQLEIHNYNTKHAPFICCPDPRCGTTFTTEPQYHGHMAAAEVHGGRPPQFSQFHILLRHYRGQELLRHYLMRKHGLAGIVSCFDAWVAVQEWRKTPTTNEQFISKAMNIFDVSDARRCMCR